MPAQPAKSIEAASIKPSRNTMADSNLDSVRGRLTATNISLRELIRFAYEAKDFQIDSAPKWADSQRFDIIVTRTGGQTNSLDDEKSLVRELLADRFQLATHRRSKKADSGPCPHGDRFPKHLGCDRRLGSALHLQRSPTTTRIETGVRERARGVPHHRSLSCPPKIN